MAKKRNSERILAKYFVWRVFRRNKIYWADGRSKKIDAGRHSLGTADHDEAVSRLHQLDAVRAVELKQADESILKSVDKDEITLERGVDLYKKYVARPAVLKGAKESTQSRYKAVFDKAVPYMKGMGLRTWNQIKKHHLESYAAFLQEEEYAYATLFLEVTTLKQLIKYLVTEKLLPRENEIDLPMEKAKDTNTYCYRAEEFAAMVELCRTTPDLDWLGDVLVALATTGMRISELASRRWGDIDFDANVISLKDESTNKRSGGGKARTTKSGYSRSFPIHAELRRVLEKLRLRGETGTVFRAVRGGVLHPDNVRTSLVKQVIEPLASRFPSDKDEIGFKDGRLHSFRHFFCSECANQGVPELLLMRWLGHRSSDMVQRYYRLHDQESQRQMKNLKFGGSDAT